MGNYPHAGSMSASKMHITSSRGNLEPHGYPVYQSEAKASSMTSLHPSSSRQSHDNQVRQQRNELRKSYLGQTSSIEQPPASVQMLSHTSPSSSSLSLSSHCSTPAPPSAALLRDVVSDRSPSPAQRISPNISPAHSRHASLASIAALTNAMPSIDENSLRMSSTDALAALVERRRNSHLPATNSVGTDAGLGGPPGLEQAQRASYYQYGEDYITRYDRVGIAISPTPSPSPSARTSLLFVDGVYPGRSPSRLRTMSMVSTSAWEGDQWGDVRRDVEKAYSEVDGSGSGSGSETTEKVLMKSLPGQTPERREPWISWRRALAVLIAVLVLAGIAVGIAFGVR